MAVADDSIDHQAAARAAAGAFKKRISLSKHDLRRIVTIPLSRVLRRAYYPAASPSGRTTFKMNTPPPVSKEQ